MRRTKPDKQAEQTAWYNAQDEKSLLYLIYQTGQKTTRLLGNISNLATLYLVLVLLAIAAGCLYALVLT